MLIFALLVLVLGLIAYLVPAPAKVNEVGRIAYFVGLLCFVWQYASKAVHLL